MRPKHLPQGSLIPDAETLATRLQSVERELAQLDTLDLAALSDYEQRGVAAHRGVLARQRHWYLARLRAMRPIHALGVQVQETVTTREGM